VESGVIQGKDGVCVEEDLRSRQQDVMATWKTCGRKPPGHVSQL